MIPTHQILVPLRAGPLTMIYDPASGFLRRIRIGEREVLRGIYAAVRDRDWATIAPSLREQRREIRQDSFKIEFTCENQAGEIAFEWRGTLEGGVDGTLIYQFDGAPKSTFLRNRIGFCVLHPIRECSGAIGRQTRTNGSVHERRFPDLIEPQIFGQASFSDLRAIAHEVEPGLWAEVSFAGEVFEMEDQRNWTDASFKTYCTPLIRPFPVEVKPGERIQQTVTLRIAHGKSSGAQPIARPAEPVSSIPFKVGLSLASHREELNPGELEQIRHLQLAHLRVDVRLGTPSWLQELGRAIREARALDLGLELAVHLPKRGVPDLADLRRELREVNVVRILALRDGEPATTVRTLDFIRSELAPIGSPVGAGSDCNFCDLNRAHAIGSLALEAADFLFWSINPQVHAFDDLSLMETIEAQADTVRTARAFAGTRPLIISPITLRPRFNPVASGPATPPPQDELPAQVDPRQLTELAAEWTRASLKTLAGSGLHSATYYETTGWRGLIERQTGSPLPTRFPSLPGQVFPVFHALAARAKP